MQKFVISIILLFSFASSHAQVQHPENDTLKLTLTKVFQILKEFSVYRQQVDWNELKTKIINDDSQTLNQVDFRKRIEQLFSSIGDRHGALLINDERISGMDTQSRRISANFITQLQQTNSKLHTKIVGEYGYILIPSNSSKDNIQTLAQSIQDSICTLLSMPINGIIIDLRINEGGSIYPLFTGLHQIIGKGEFGAFTNPNGKPKERWKLRNGQLHVHKQIVASVKPRCKLSKHIMVAVLLSPITASAGEMLAIALKGRRNTVFIGERTFGLTTGITTFKVQNYLLSVSTSFSADRAGNVYRSDVVPNIEIVGGDDFNHLNKDIKVSAAIRWFTSRNSR